MKRLFLSVFVIISVFSCSKNDDNVTNNNFIPNINFDSGGHINLSLPEYNNLKFPGNYIVLSQYGYHGIVVYYQGNNQYKAYELSDPNHPVSSCSYLSVDSSIATCNCDDNNTYQIAGLGAPLSGTNGSFSLKEYAAISDGSIVRVFN